MSNMLLIKPEFMIIGFNSRSFPNRFNQKHRRWPLT